jgi:hypothetical protein
VHESLTCAQLVSQEHGDVRIRQNAALELILGGSIRIGIRIRIRAHLRRHAECGDTSDRSSCGGSSGSSDSGIPIARPIDCASSID